VSVLVFLLGVFLYVWFGRRPDDPEPEANLPEPDTDVPESAHAPGSQHSG
jgi:hypothetical protein